MSEFEGLEFLLNQSAMNLLVLPKAVFSPAIVFLIGA